jgi:hypothetical protein
MAGCSGWKVWIRPRLLLAGAPGPAGHLAEQLKGALGGARIAVGEPEIGIDHADQRHQREIVPLGDELRADDDIGLALLRSPPARS